jgi:beta-1,4-mannosyl-glycoprotein beta-1,4-N-acetylglucosaminyltransferase
MLKDIVDYFVIIEANKTHKNNSKEFVYEKYKQIFIEYFHKIIYIKVDDMPDSKDYWRLENFQRNCIMRGLQNCLPEDLIIISDIDEIPNPDAFRSLHKNKSIINFSTYNDPQKNRRQLIRFPESIFKKQFGMSLLNKTPLVLEQTLFYYFVNCQCKEKWNGSIITKAKNLSTPQELRNLRNELPRIQNGGWHFSYLGGVEKVILKLNSIVESPTNSYSEDHIRHCINNGLDIYERKGTAFEYEFVDIEHAFPTATTSIIKALTEKYPYLYFNKTS